MIVYYAHAIDQKNNTDLDLASSMRSLGVVVFDPGTAWRMPLSPKLQPELQRANLAVLRHCDVLVASLDKDTMSIGVGVELVEAHNQGIPTIVHGNLKPSWALAYLGFEQTNQIRRVLDWLGGI